MQLDRVQAQRENTFGLDAVYRSSGKLDRNCKVTPVDDLAETQRPGQITVGEVRISVIPDAGEGDTVVIGGNTYRVAMISQINQATLGLHLRKI